MIQRIQTLFLLVAMGALIALIFLPIAQFVDYSSNFYTLGFYGVVENITQSVPSTTWMTAVYPVLCMGIVLMILITMFMYKKRPLQIKMCFYLLLLLVVFVIFNFWMFNIVRKDALWKVGAYTIFSYLPYISAVCVYLARRAIQKDEELVKSADRIR